jgi:EmrB/QacA subfamily drug resistance transporter
LTPEHDSHQTNLSRAELKGVFAGLMLGMLVAALAQTIVATALPTIVGELGGQDQLSWVVSATLLAATASTPLWGKLSDVYGRKTLFQAALGVFVLGSLLAGFSQNMPELIGFRALQGVGIGGVMALSQAIIGDVVAPRERGRYQGVLGSAFGVATIGGPLLGGFLVDAVSWRWCFFVTAPISLLAMVVVQRALHVRTPRQDHAIDWLGATLLVGGTSSLMLLASLGGKEFAWGSATSVGLALLALLLVAGTVWQEHRHPEPILPPALFRIRTAALAAAASLAVGIAMFGAIIYLPLYLQVVKGESPTASGLLTLPLVLSLLVTSVLSGRRISHTGRYRAWPIAGMTIASVGFLLLAQVDVDTSLVVLGLFQAVVGAGIGMVMQVLVLVTQNAVPRRMLGVATSTVTFFRTLGGALGVAVFGAVLSNRLTVEIADRMRDLPGGAPGAGGGTAALLGTPAAIHGLPAPVREAVVGGFAASLHTVFLTAVPFAVLGLLLVLLLREEPLRSGQVPQSEIDVPFEETARGQAGGGSGASPWPRS